MAAEPQQQAALWLLIICSINPLCFLCQRPVYNLSARRVATDLHTQPGWELSDNSRTLIACLEVAVKSEVLTLAAKRHLATFPLSPFVTGTNITNTSDCKRSV